MPNDENNPVVSQNQQPNPITDSGMVGNQINQNGGNISDNVSGGSDDFDFSFDDSGGPTNTVDDTHLFTNPDSSENQNFGTQSVDNQERTGMFKTPDEQENPGQTSSSGDENSYLADIDPNEVKDESVVSDGQGEIPDQTQEKPQELLDKDIQDMISFDETPGQDENITQESTESLQPNFGASDGLSDNVSNSVQDVNISATAPSTLGGIATDTQSEEVNNTENNQVSGDSSGDDWLKQEDKEVEEAFGQPSSSDSPTLLNVNMSGNDVAQNVENIMTSTDENIQQNNSSYVPDEGEYSQMSDLLNSSGTGQVDFSNLNNQTVENQVINEENVGAETGAINNVIGGINENIQSPVMENVQTPVMENAQTPVMENIQSPVMENAQTPVMENMQTPVMENMQTPVMENIQAPVMENVQTPVMENMQTPVMENVQSPVMENVQTPVMENVQSPVMENMQAPVMENVQSPVMESAQAPVMGNTGNYTVSDIQSIDMNNLGNFGGTTVESNGGIDAQVAGFGLGALNETMGESIAQDVPLNLDSIDQDIQNLKVDQGPISGQVQASDQLQIQNGQQVVQQVVQQPVQQPMQQNVPVKKRKKQSGFKAIGIFLLVVLILGGLGFGATKMFPDKFSLDSIFGGGKVVEYIDNSGIFGDSEIVDDENENNDIDGEENLDVNSEDNVDLLDENTGDENIDENLESEENTLGDEENGEDVEDNQPEDLQHDTENGEEVLDPNSLAALLSDDSTGNAQDSSLEAAEPDVNTGEIEDELPTSEDNNDSSFDPFAEIDELIGDDAENKKKLEDYLSKGELYKDLGTVNNNSMMAKYGDWIVVTAEAQLTKLENGEEIDTTVFAKFDEILEKISNLAN